MSLLIERIFTYACSNGYLNAAKFLFYIKPNINISAKHDSVFQMACYNGHLSVAKWLLSVKPNINISANNDFCLKFTLYYIYLNTDNLNVASWIQSLMPFKYVVKQKYYSIRPDNKANLLAILTFLKIKGYTQASLIYAIINQQ